MHLQSVSILPEDHPGGDVFPFCLPLFRRARTIEFHASATFFVGENGTGKSTLLEAMARKCGIHIWENGAHVRAAANPFENALHECMEVRWTAGPTPGAFFSGEMFRDFARCLEEWAVDDPGALSYFGGRSLLSQSHGQSLMSYFRARYRRKGLYLLDEPETALSPRSQLELLKILAEAGRSGRAQFVIVSHSPILLGLPGAMLYSFDNDSIAPISYERTDHYRIYKDFMVTRETMLEPMRAHTRGPAHRETA